jgi:hypothetical protein
MVWVGGFMVALNTPWIKGEQITMSLNELIETYNLPGLGTGVYKGTAQLVRNTAHKVTNFKLKKARRHAMAFLRKQYYITHAMGDLRLAISRNEDIVISSLIISTVLSFAFAATSAQFVLSFMRTAYAFSNMTGTSIALLTLFVVGMLTAVGGWLMAFIMNMFSIAVMEGATRKRNRSVRATVRRSLKYASRITNAWLLVLTAIGLPLIGAGIIGVTYMRLFVHPIKFSSSLVYQAVALAVTWTLIILATYGLVPTIALFEPEITLTQAFGRSRRLVKRKGRIFLMAGSLLLAGAIVLAYLVSTGIKSALHLESGPIFFTSIFMILCVANGVCVILYRKRRLAKKH